MFASRVPLAVVDDRMRGEISETVVGIMLVVEQDTLWQRWKLLERIWWHDGHTGWGRICISSSTRTSGMKYIRSWRPVGVVTFSRFWCNNELGARVRPPYWLVLVFTVFRDFSKRKDCIQAVGVPLTGIDISSNIYGPASFFDTVDRCRLRRRRGCAKRVG